MAALTLTACHYGQNEANDTLERNETYKNDKAEYSVNRAGEGGKLNESSKEETVQADTTKSEAPAEKVATDHK